MPFLFSLPFLPYYERTLKGISSDFALKDKTGRSIGGEIDHFYIRVSRMCATRKHEISAQNRFVRHVAPFLF